MDRWMNCWLDTHVPSELFELVLPSVDSLLPCRVTRFLISTAMPVSVLRRMVLRSFFVPPSEKNKQTQRSEVPLFQQYNPQSKIIRGSLNLRTNRCCENIWTPTYLDVKSRGFLRQYLYSISSHSYQVHIEPCETDNGWMFLSNLFMSLSWAAFYNCSQEIRKYSGWPWEHPSLHYLFWSKFTPARRQYHLISTGMSLHYWKKNPPLHRYYYGPF